jgi:hypothetical protein
MSRKRSERRHHHQRMIERVKNFWWLQANRYFGSEDQRQEHIKKMSETRHPCSCHMCGNARKHWNQDTLQEKKFKSDDTDELFF